MSATKIDPNLIPAVIRDAVDPEILKRAQSIEWSINRDTGDDERGYLDASGVFVEPVQQRRPISRQSDGGKKAVQWMERVASCDSGLAEASSTSPDLNWSSPQHQQQQQLEAVATTQSTGSMKRHPYSTGDGHPFPIYQVNKEQLANDVVFDVAPAQKGGERTVHYERAQKTLSQMDLEAMGFDGTFFKPNSRSTMDEREEEIIETCELSGGSHELEALYANMRTNTNLDSLEPIGNETDSSQLRQSVEFEYVDDIELDAIGAECNATERFRAERLKCTILLEMPLQEIKVEPKPIVVEMKEPLRLTEPAEEKLLEDPDLLWMRMSDARYGPPFGTMTKYKAGEAEWIGPPCELCHKQIEERRCMLAENRKFHCWHFSCSFCLKTLRPSDFLIAEADNKPYCLNCHRREFPEISLAKLNLVAESGEDLTKQRP